MNIPAVSVILPTHNRSRVLSRAMRSVLAQTFCDFELLVIDDGSTDNTRTVVESFADPRVIYLRQENAGAACARNAAIKASSAPLIAFQDSDDEWLIDKLRLQLATLQCAPPNTALICGGYIALMRDGRIRYLGADSRMQVGDWDSSNIYDFHFITPTWLARRDAMEKLGLFDEDMPNLEDWEFAMRLSQKYRIVAVNKPLLVKHSSADSLNTVKESRILGLERIIERHSSLWRQNPEVLAKLYGELGRCLSLTGRMRKSRASMLRAIRLDPLEYRYWAQWLLSWTGRNNFVRLLRMKRRG